MPFLHKKDGTSIKPSVASNRETASSSPCAGGGHFVTSIPASPPASRLSAQDFHRDGRKLAWRRYS